MDTFAGMPSGTLRYLFNGFDGAAIQKTFAVSADDWVQFDWFYRGGDFASIAGFDIDDPAWVSINGGIPIPLGRLGEASLLKGGMSVGDFGASGWQTFTHVVSPAQAAAGPLTITIGVNNALDGLLPSFLAVDNLTINRDFDEGGVAPPISPNGGFESGDLTGWSSAGSVFAAETLTIGVGGYDTVINATQGGWFAVLQSTGADANGPAVDAGSSAWTPYLPTPPAGPYVWSFSSLTSGYWVDPPFGDGFLYTGTLGTQFDAIAFPTGPAFVTFSDLVLTTPGCAIAGLFGAGPGNQTSFDFTTACGGPVSSFSISAATPIFDAGDPLGFPLQVFYSGGGPGSLDMTALGLVLPVVVPEPATFALSAAALALAVCLRRRRAARYR